MPDPAALPDNIPSMTIRPDPKSDGKKPGKLSYDDMVAKWTARGYPKAAAQGIADNMMRESRGDPAAIGDDGTSRGLFQHHATRKADLEEFAKKQGKSPDDPDLQIDFADQELKTKFPTLRANLLKGDDRAGAEDAFKRVFERPASIMWDKNLNLASDRYRFSDYAMKEHDGRKNTELVYMSPADYLDLSPELDGKPFANPSGRALKASVDRGEPVESVPTLDMQVDGSTGTVTDQDGRHRALLAQQEGVDAIPVAIRQKGQGTPTEIQGMSGTVLPNDFRKAAEVPKSAPRPAANAGNPAPTQDPISLQGQAPEQPSGAQPPQPAQRSLLGRIGDAIIPRAEAAEPAAQGSDDGWVSVSPATPGAQPGGGGQGQDHDGWMPVTAPSAQSAGDRYAGWDTAAPAPPVPMENEPGVHRGTILPFASDDSGKLITTPSGWPKLYTPELLRGPIRGAVEGGQEALGERPVNDPAARSDITSAASLGAGSVPAGVVKSTAATGGAGAFRPMYEFVSRVVGSDISKNDAALRIVARMERDQQAGGATAQDMLDIMNATPDKPLVLGDVVGENALAYLGRLARAPGESRQIITKGLNDRDMGAGTRLTADVDKSIASGSAYDAGKELSDLRAKAAKPAYDAAYQHPPVNPDAMKPEGAIGALMPRPSMRAGMANARKIAAEEGVDMNTLGIDLDAQGEPFFTKVPTWKTLDYVKRGVDNVVEQYRDKTTGKLVLDTYGRAADATRTDYRSTLRDLNPDYGKALDTYSGPSTTLDAMKAGQDFLHRRPEEITRRVASLSPGDREFYKLGAADTLRAALAKKGVGADETKALLHSQYMRDQLRPLFDNNDAYERFVKSVEAEGRMFGTRYSALGNSRTAAREAEDQSPEIAAMAHAARGAAAALSHNPLAAIWGAIRAGESVNALRNPAINADAARLLMTPLNDTATRGRVNALKDFLSILPATRNYLSQYASPSARFMAPGGIVGGNALAGGGPIPSMTIRPGNGQ